MSTFITPHIQIDQYIVFLLSQQVPGFEKEGTTYLDFYNSLDSFVENEQMFVDATNKIITYLQEYLKTEPDPANKGSIINFLNKFIAQANEKKYQIRKKDKEREKIRETSMTTRGKSSRQATRALSTVATRFPMKTPQEFRKVKAKPGPRRDKALPLTLIPDTLPSSRIVEDTREETESISPQDLMKLVQRRGTFETPEQKKERLATERIAKLAEERKRETEKIRELKQKEEEKARTRKEKAAKKAKDQERKARRRDLKNTSSLLRAEMGSRRRRFASPSEMNTTILTTAEPEPRIRTAAEAVTIFGITEGVVNNLKKDVGQAISLTFTRKLQTQDQEKKQKLIRDSLGDFNMQERKLDLAQSILESHEKQADVKTGTLLPGFSQEEISEMVQALPEPTARKLSVGRKDEPIELGVDVKIEIGLIIDAIACAVNSKLCVSDNLTDDQKDDMDVTDILYKEYKIPAKKLIGVLLKKRQEYIDQKNQEYNILLQTDRDVYKEGLNDDSFLSLLNINFIGNEPYKSAIDEFIT